MAQNLKEAWGDEPLKYDENGRPLTMSRRAGQTPYTRRTIPLKLQAFAQRMREKRGAPEPLGHTARGEATYKDYLEKLGTIRKEIQAVVENTFDYSKPLVQSVTVGDGMGQDYTMTILPDKEPRPETFAQRMQRKRGEQEPDTRPLTEADILRAQKAIEETTAGHPIELIGTRRETNAEAADRIDREDHLFR